MESEGPSVGWEERDQSSTGSSDQQAGEMLIRLNGKDRKVRPGTTIAGLLADLGVSRDRVAVEVEREIVRRANWEGTQLTPGVSVEVVHFVGGG
jgi:thiamine biosynthesis protein ThiS